MLNPADYVDIQKPWFMPYLGRKELNSFLERTNRHALGHFGLWLVLLGGLGYLAARLFLAGSWWALPAFLAYGIIYSSNNARWHECSHGTCFRSDWLNKFFYWLCGSMEFRDGIEFRWSHARHHSYTMMRTIDPEIPLPRPPKIWHYFVDYLYLRSGFYAVRNLILNALGIAPKSVRNYVPEEEFKAMFASARLALLPHILVAALSICLGSWLPVLLYGLPRFYGCFVQWAFNGLQHAGMAENEYDHRVSSRSFVLNPVLSFLLHQHGVPHRASHVPVGALASAAETQCGDQGRSAGALQRVDPGAGRMLADTVPAEKGPGLHHPPAAAVWRSSRVPAGGGRRFSRRR